MAGIDASVQPSLTPDEESAIKEILGYLNFSSGAGDPRLAKNLDRLRAEFVLESGQPVIRRLLGERLDRLAANSPAFQNSEQARSVLALAFDEVLPAYRRHHADLLFHLDADAF